MHKDSLCAQGGISFQLATGAHLLQLRESSSMRTWEGNRELDAERVERMLTAQRDRLNAGQPVNLFLPTPITACRYKGELLLMDGQHRMAVLQALAARDLDPAGVTLLFCEIPCAAPTDLEDVFIRINSGTPVPASYYNGLVRRVLGDFLAQLARKFPKAVSPAPRPQRPNFNKERARDEMATQIPLRDAIIDRKVSAAGLLELALAENEIERCVAGAGGHRKVPESALARAERTEFFLGLREGWAVSIALRAAAR